MSRTLTAADRSALIRLASTMEKGSPERKAILRGVQRTASLPEKAIRRLVSEGFDLQDDSSEGDWPNVSCEINNGYCIEFSYALQEALPGSRVRSTPEDEDLPGHQWVEWKGRAYDAEAPEGVRDWRYLPLFRRYSRR